MNIVDKNILTVETGIICHQVNCQKVMRSGLAYQIRQLYPQVYQAYISKPNWKLGDVQFVEVNSSKQLVVANLAGQFNYGTHTRQTDYKAVESCLKTVKEYVDKYNLPIYLPYYLGSYSAGGPTPESKAETWRVVSRLIEENIPEAIICKI